MKGFPGESVDMIFTDLPYGITENKWDCRISLKDLWILYKRIIKKEERGAQRESTIHFDFNREQYCRF